MGALCNVPCSDPNITGCRGITNCTLAKAHAFAYINGTRGSSTHNDGDVLASQSQIHIAPLLSKWLASKNWICRVWGPKTRHESRMKNFTPHLCLQALLQSGPAAVSIDAGPYNGYHGGILNCSATGQPITH